MKGEERGSTLMDLLYDLYPGREPLLFHVLICSSCRERASAALLERHGTRLVLPVGGLGTSSPRPRRCGASSERRGLGPTPSLSGAPP